MKMDEHVILFSGGPDSLIGYFHIIAKFKKTPTGIYVPLGHKYQEREITAVNLFKNKWNMQVDVLPQYESYGLFEREDAEIPGRNLLLALLSAHLNTSNIWIVAQEGEREIPDRSDMFFTMTSALLSLLFRGDIKVGTMFNQMSKVEMVKWFLKTNEIDLTAKERELMLRDTHSCYKNGFNPCGECPACFRRWVAFSLNGIDEGRMFKDIAYSDIAHYYESEIMEGKYKGKRGDEIKLALKGARGKK